MSDTLMEASLQYPARTSMCLVGTCWSGPFTSWIKAPNTSPPKERWTWPTAFTYFSVSLISWPVNPPLHFNMKLNMLGAHGPHVGFDLRTSPFTSSQHTVLEPPFNRSTTFAWIFRSTWSSDSTLATLTLAALWATDASSGNMFSTSFEITSQFSPERAASANCWSACPSFSSENLSPEIKCWSDDGSNASAACRNARRVTLECDPAMDLYLIAVGITGMPFAACNIPLGCGHGQTFVCGCMF